MTRGKKVILITDNPETAEAPSCLWQDKPTNPKLDSLTTAQVFRKRIGAFALTAGNTSRKQTATGLKSQHLKRYDIGGRVPPSSMPAQFTTVSVFLCPFDSTREPSSALCVKEPTPQE
jgi:hypothetical protein